MPRRLARRTFIASAGAAVAAPFILTSRTRAAKRKLRHAAIGVANRGRSNLVSMFGSGRLDVVAVCDVDQRFLTIASEKLPEARVYRDWRELLEKEADAIESVTVSTPDHMHAAIAMTALKMGKHVYCEKPLTHDVHETRRVTLAAREAGVVTQMGIQGHSSAKYRAAAKLIQDGVLGDVRAWHSWLEYGGPRRKLPTAPADPVPPQLEWDLWLGTANARPYKRDIYHPRRWRSWKDFGTGSLGDFGCHIFDPIFTALGLTAPTKIKAETPEPNPQTWPAWQVIRYEFPGTPVTGGKTVAGMWYDGGKMPQREGLGLPDSVILPDRGSVIVGEKGSMLLPHEKGPMRLFPEERFKELQLPAIRETSHYHQFVEACLGETEASAPFDYAGPLTEAVLLGTVASRVPGKALEWDAGKLAFSNAPEANALLNRTYRKGWRVPGL